MTELQVPIMQSLDDGYRPPYEKLELARAQSAKMDWALY
jgi:hypothetical protein